MIIISSRALLQSLFSVVALLSWTAAQATPVVRSVDAVGITVNDLDRAVAFYTQVLGFERIAETEVADDRHERLYGVFGLRLRTAQLRLGEERIELLEFLAPRGRPTPADSKSNDLWFQHIAIIVSDIDRAYAHLRQHDVEHASPGPQRLPDWNPNAGGISAFYFRDPDGNHLEILQFPADKGDPKWHENPQRLFLGIDHTAIVVDDTETSLRFYRDALGLSVAGASENFGIEQERLNNVFGARLRITALRAQQGPGIELLEYLAPRTGRPMPADTKANDDWHWQIHLSARVEDADRVIRAHQGRLVSRDVVPFDRLQPEATYERALMIRDPDGHALLLGEPMNARQLSSTSAITWRLR